MKLPSSLRSSAIPIALLVVVHVALVVAMHLRAFDGLFNDAAHRLGPGTDFGAYFFAGKAWLADKGVYGHGPGFGFRYHPMFAMGMAATLGQLPPEFALVAWIIINEALLFIILFFVHRRVDDPKRAMYVTLLLLFFSPYFLENYMGNASFVAAALLLIAFDALDRGHRWPAMGILLASLIVKPVGLVFVPVLLARRLWLESASVLAAFVLLGLPYFIAHPADLEAVVALNVSAVPAAGWVVHCGNQGLHALLTDLATRLAEISPARLASFDELPPAARLVLTVLPIVLAGVALRATLLPKVRSRTGIALVLWSCVYLLGYKDVWEHSYAFILPPLAYAWACDFEFLPRRLLLVGSVGLALPTAFVLYDLPLGPGPRDPERYLAFATAMLHHATKPLWLILVFVAAIRAAHAIARSAPTS